MKSNPNQWAASMLRNLRSETAVFVMKIIMAFFIGGIIGIGIAMSITRYAEKHWSEEVVRRAADVQARGLGLRCGDQFTPGYWEFMARNGSSKASPIAAHWLETSGSGTVIVPPQGVPCRFVYTR